MKLLFICNANMSRSPTAEELFREKHETKSAGLLSRKNPVTKELLEWADKVFVVEAWQKHEIQNRFPGISPEKIINLDIPNKYFYMQPELQETIKKKTKKYLSY
jgi:predicted protein tyrosine phosphatase